MNRRKLLTLGTATVFVIGFVAISISFLKSLAPNPKAHAALSTIDISALKKGEFSFHPHPIYGKVGFSNDYNWSVFIYKHKNGNVKLWDIPMKGRLVGMPDQRWYKPSYACKDFGPTKVNGEVDESKPIKCHDSEYSYSSWSWDFEGKASSTNVDDLQQTKGSFEGSNFVFLKQKS